jgi:hypothetical protein
MTIEQFNVDGNPLITSVAEIEETSTQLYTHPTLREQNHNDLRFRLEQIRNRRLVAAIEYKQNSDIKREKASNKLLSQYRAQSETLRRKLVKIDEDIEKFDRALDKLITMSHQMSLLEEE